MVTILLCREGDQATVQCIVEGGRPTPKVLLYHEHMYNSLLSILPKLGSRMRF